VIKDQIKERVSYRGIYQLFEALNEVETKVIDVTDEMDIQNK
jgi:hypothetical protein